MATQLEKLTALATKSGIVLPAIPIEKLADYKYQIAVADKETIIDRMMEWAKWRTRTYGFRINLLRAVFVIHKDEIFV